MLTDLQNLRWGSYTPAHFVTLALFPLTVLALYFLLRRRRARTQKIVLTLCSLWGIAAIIYNLVSWGRPLEYLPLHLCSLTAILLPLAVLTEKPLFQNMLPLFGIGAAFAVICNQGAANFRITTWVFVFYYVPHLFECSVPIVLMLLRRFSPSPRYILPVMGTTFGIYTLVHFCNLAVNRLLLFQGVTDGSGKPATVNYMFSLAPEGIPPLEFFWRLIPHPYFYMLLAVPAAAGILLLTDLPGMLARRRGKQKNNNRIRRFQQKNGISEEI